MSKAIQDIAAERQRQTSDEGWTAEHDDVFRNGEMAGAAACYVMAGLKIGNDILRKQTADLTFDLWPWARHWWKPKDRRRDLVRAGALIVAEIERLDRTSLAPVDQRGE